MSKTERPFRSLCRWNAPYPSVARDCDESASAGVIEAINVIGNNTINRKCNWKSGETRPSEVGLYRTPKKKRRKHQRNKPTRSYRNFQNSAAPIVFLRRSLVGQRFSYMLRVHAVNCKNLSTWKHQQETNNKTTTKQQDPAKRYPGNFGPLLRSS